jgi:RNA polymerase sigma factor (sigma-70 family)
LSVSPNVVSVPPTSSPEVASPEQTRWFVEEVHAHDTSLKSYLRGSFPSVRDVDDIVQESYVRVWTYRAAEPIRSAKAFLFKIAQRIALDVLRRERRSPLASVGNLEELDVLEEKPAAHEALGRDERIRLLIEAIDALPRRCREVIILRKLKLMSQRETSQQLGISEKGVEIQLTRGLERCRKFLRRRGLTNFFRDGY